MRSSRNRLGLEGGRNTSLIDWKMRSSRNSGDYDQFLAKSLIDWKMRSSRNPHQDSCRSVEEFNRLENAL